MTVGLFMATPSDANKYFKTEIIVLFIMKNFILLQGLLLS